MSRVKENLETKEGWRRFVYADPLRPPNRWSRAKYQKATPAARAHYDEQRRAYHGEFGPVIHPQAQTVLDEMQAQLRVNRYDPQLPLISLVLDGDSFLGKSTLLWTFGRLFERRYAAEHTRPGEALGDACPVVNLSLEADMRVVDLNEAILRFLGAPIPPRGRDRDLKHTVVDVVRAAGVRVVLIDELNFLKKRYVKHQVVNDHLKWLMNHLPVTFVFAGVDCAATTLVSAKQTSRRLKWFTLQPFSNELPEAKREWQQLLMAIEQHLVLLDAPPRMLSGSAAMRNELHRRSGGSIGTLLSLVRGAADRAMVSGKECIDIELLAKVQTERGAQEDERLSGPVSKHGRQRPQRGASAGTAFASTELAA